MDESWEKWLPDLEKVEWHLFNEHNNMKMNMNSLEEELKGENPVKPELSHNLSIAYSNVLPFGNSSLNISIIAQVDREFSMTMDHLVKKLNEDLQKCCYHSQL
ncbi:hypothetical protein VNO78_26204 [Psophocarpus tetragonolobus]|uniref:Uncharacterized protein n=1 Tax=Psophocarpus tetragonolobus TaxID=3891 RepID=A0AAN9X8Q0_PSOTE